MKLEDIVTRKCVCGNDMTLVVRKQCVLCGFTQKNDLESCAHMDYDELKNGENLVYIGDWLCTCGKKIKSEPVKFCLDCEETYHPASKRKFHVHDGERIMLRIAF